MTKSWCIKVSYLPSDITRDQLARKFDRPRDTIYVPYNQRGPNHYAWVNGFSNEVAAKQFAVKWKNQRINLTKIKCVAKPSKITTRSRSPTTSASSTSRWSSSSSTQSTGKRRKSCYTISSRFKEDVAKVQ
jgi:hypothetical protein